MPKPWETLAVRYTIRDPWTNTRAERVRLADGRIIDPYYIHEYPNWALVMPVTPEGNVLLVRAYRHGLQRSDLELPGGIIDNTDADPATGAARELSEETGYRPTQPLRQICQISANPAILSNWCWGFLAEGVVPDPTAQRDTHEELELVQVPLGDLAGRIQRGEVIQALHISTMLLGLRMLGR